MKIKTMVTYSPEEQDREYAKFCVENKVQFTQSHVNILNPDGMVKKQYTLVVFYVPSLQIKLPER